MRTIVPYTKIHTLTQKSLDDYAPEAELFFLGFTPDAYFELIKDLWAAGEGFLIIEHDIEIHESVVSDAANCKEPWCVWPYYGHDPNLPFTQSLGCTRFSTELLQAQPDLMEVVGNISQGLPAKDWRRLDVTIAPTLNQRGYTQHIHSPQVLHHHIYPNGCACGGTHD